MEPIETSICHIEEKGVCHIFGYNLKDLAKKLDFEGMTYLLLHDEIPAPSRKRIFKKKVRKEQHLHPAVIRALKALPSGTPPLVALRTGINTIATLDTYQDSLAFHDLQEKSRSLTAKLPLIAAIWHRFSEGKPAQKEDCTKSLAYNFLKIYHAKEPTAQEEELLDYCMLLLIEHGINPSTLMLRIAAASRTDYYSAILSALNALKGSPNAAAEAYTNAKTIKYAEEKYVHDFIKKSHKKKQPIMGIGHMLYKAKDPRAALLEQQIKKHWGTDTTYHILKLIEENAKEHNLYPNIDLYLGVVYEKLKIAPEDFMALFACARTPGWSAHYMEQLRMNKPIRSETVYVGRMKRKDHSRS